MSAQLSLYSDEPFLLSVARSIVNKHAQNLPFVHVVLPTRRACLHFKEQLATLKNEPFLGPKVVAIDDFVHQATGIAPASKVELLLSVYEQFRRFTDAKLDTFAPLGIAMLQDFALIERNLDQIRAGKFFAWLEEAKAIDRWAEELGEQAKLGPKAQDYLSFWQHFKNTYKALRKKMKAEKKGFPALVYRIFLEDLDLLKEAGAFRFVNWVGFNHLTEVEIQIIERMTKEGCGATFWDFDSHYCTKPKRGHEAGAHEAGYFFRYLQEKKIFYLNPSFVKNRIATQPKSITFWALSNRAVQANKAADLLHQLLDAEPDFAQKTNFVALLLPDETLLQPLLRAIRPEFFEQVNITMGLKITHSQAFRLIKIFFSLRRNHSFLGFRSSDVAELLAHPFFSLRAHSDSTKQNLKALKSLCRTQARLTQTQVALLAEAQVFFMDWTDARSCASALCRALSWVCGLLNARFYLENVEREFAFRIYEAVEEIAKNIPQERAELFERLLLEVLRDETVPFSGQPLASIQVMGLLESRALDFEHIIVLSCNEGILPKAKTADSVIPFELRKTYHLQTHLERDAAIAYTFYRLLHHCKTAHYIYDSSNHLGKSRFLLQIEMELAHLTQINFAHHLLSLPQPTQKALELKVEKTPSVVNKILEKLKSGISPSTINRFLQNPLEFYLVDILGLKSSVEPDETIDAATFGTMIHQCLEVIFKKFLNQVPAQLEQISNQTILEIIEKVSQESFGEFSTREGKNYLLKQTAAMLVEAFLKAHKDTKAKIMAVETPIWAEFKTPEVELKLVGVVDRMDLEDNQLKIRDYKTGGYYEKALRAKSWEDLFNKEKSKLVQLLLYKYILLKNKELEIWSTIPESVEVVCGFYFLKSKDKEFKPYGFESEATDNQVFIQETEVFLSQIVSMMLDEQLPFSEQPIGSVLEDEQE
jgi:hypothetical protein